MEKNIGLRIKHRREHLGMSVDELAEKLNKNRTTIYRYESGNIKNLPLALLEPIAKALQTTPEYLMCWDDKPDKQTQAVTIPVLGRVAAGIPIEAVEDIIDYEEIPSSMARTGEYFGLKIQGHSMEPQICDGDIVIVRKQSDVENGNIAIVLVNGEEGTCKKILKSGTGLTLVSFNPAFDPVFFSNKQIRDLPVLIIGKAVEVRRKLM